MVARYYTAYTQYWELAEKALLVAGRDENEEEDDDRTFADPEGGPRCNVVTEEEFAALRELKATIDRDLHQQQLLPLPASSKSHTRPAGMDERSLFEQCATRDSSCIPACRWPSWMSGAHTPAGATAGDARDHAAANVVKPKAKLNVACYKSCSQLVVRFSLYVISVRTEYSCMPRHR